MKPSPSRWSGHRLHSQRESLIVLLGWRIASGSGKDNWSNNDCQWVMNVPPGRPWHSDIKSRLIHHPALNKELENVSAIYLCEGSGVRGLVGDLSVIFICGRARGLIRWKTNDCDLPVVACTTPHYQIVNLQIVKTFLCFYLCSWRSRKALATSLWDVVFSAQTLLCLLLVSL